MKLAIVIILALACNMAFSEQIGKLCDSASSYWNGTGCSTCPTGCNECVSKGNAPSCINCGSNTGKYLNIVSDKGECANCSLNCLACRGPSPADCTQAAVGYKVSPTGIFKCSKPGCLYCSADDVCAKCEFGNRLDAGACTACSGDHCAECPAAISNCTRCTYKYQLTSGICTPCEGCTSCPCTACVPGRRFNNGTCIKCTDAGCVTCPSDVGQCTACISGFYVNGTSCKQCATNCTACTSENKCTTCSSLGFFTLNDGVCTVCPDNCDKCDAKGACLTCKANYHLDGTKCTQCPDGCDGCDASGVCTKCKSGTIPKTDKKGCDPCPNFCSECSSTTVCTKCNPLLANPDGKNGCKLFASCARGQQLDNNSTCSNGTLENCVYGNTAASACVECSKAYYLNDKVCTPCPNGCESCAKNSDGYVTCLTVAQPGYSITKTNGKSDNTAYVIGSNIATVDRNNAVKTCMPNNYFGKPIKNEANTQCVAPEKCTYPSGTGSNWVCFLEGSNAAKVTVSLFAVIIAALFTL